MGKCDDEYDDNDNVDKRLRNESLMNKHTRISWRLKKERKFVESKEYWRNGYKDWTHVCSPYHRVFYEEAIFDDMTFDD